MLGASSSPSRISVLCSRWRYTCGLINTRSMKSTTKSCSTYLSQKRPQFLHTVSRMLCPPDLSPAPSRQSVFTGWRHSMQIGIFGRSYRGIMAVHSGEGWLMSRATQLDRYLTQNTSWRGTVDDWWGRRSPFRNSILWSLLMARHWLHASVGKASSGVVKPQYFKQN